MKQHGCEFDAPKCPGHQKEMILSRMKPGRVVYWEWYCPVEGDECCEPRPVTPLEANHIPRQVFEGYGD